ncbi:MAG: chromate transporter [Mediterranea sp.]|nr:chromate transporter [Mediterranea sp.]
MSTCLQLFCIFCKTGAFTIGGGYAMAPLIENEMVNKRKWIAAEDFLDVLAVSQSTPGVFAVNLSIFVGYKLKGLRGSLAATLGAILPSFVAILLIAMFFRHIKDNPAVERIFKGIRPAVAALIAAPAFTMAKPAGITRRTIAIPIAAALLIWQLGCSPIAIILLAAAGGYLLRKNK